MNSALILIDIQNDYFPGGRMEVEGSLQASLKAAKVLTCFRGQGLPVIHVQHVSVRPEATFFLPGTSGVEFYNTVTPLSGEPVMQKNYPNSFRDTPLLDHLRGNSINRLVVCGMMTHMCVDSTVRAAFDHGFKCTLLSDACATRSLALQDNVIPAETVHAAFMAALGPIFARVVTVDEFLSKSQ